MFSLRLLWYLKMISHYEDNGVRGLWCRLYSPKSKSTTYDWRDPIEFWQYLRSRTICNISPKYWVFHCIASIGCPKHLVFCSIASIHVDTNSVMAEIPLDCLRVLRVSNIWQVMLLTWLELNNTSQGYVYDCICLRIFWLCVDLAAFSCVKSRNYRGEAPAI